MRAHSECLTGDVLGSQRCDCGTQLDAAMAAIAAEGRGVVLYLRGHEGRGIGLLAKLRAYEMQDHGSDTVDANLELGLPVDAREYVNAAQMLADLGVESVRRADQQPGEGRRAWTASASRCSAVRRCPSSSPSTTAATSRPSATASATRSEISHERCRTPGSRRRVDASGLSLGIVCARWHGQVTDRLLERAVAAAEGARRRPRRSVVRVAGALELPVVAQQLARGQRRGRLPGHRGPGRYAPF